MNQLNLHIYVGDGYSFFITCNQDQTIADTIREVQTQLNFLFQSTAQEIELKGLMDDHFNDIPPHYQLKSFFGDNSPVICVLSLASTVDSDDALTISQIWPHPKAQVLCAVSTSLTPEDRSKLISIAPPPFPHVQPISIPQPVSSSQKCQPYCQPLAKFGDCQCVCPICGEVKPYFPTTDQYCTEFCKTTEARKAKSHGLDFCSICMSRYRNGKYPRGCVHQCKNCHRPWLLLNSDGICRSCHCLMVQNANAPFRQVYHRVPGSGDK